MFKKTISFIVSFCILSSAVSVPVFAETYNTAVVSASKATSSYDEVSKFKELYPYFKNGTTVLGFQDAFLITTNTAYIKVRNSGIKVTTGWYAVPIVENNNVRDFEICYVKSEKNNLATGFVKINKKPYYFNKDGVLQFGWQTVGDCAYYADEQTGVIAVGVTQINDKKFLFDSKGRACTGLYTKDSKVYYFGKDGVCTLETSLEDFNKNKDSKYASVADVPLSVCRASNVAKLTVANENGSNLQYTTDKPWLEVLYDTYTSNTLKVTKFQRSNKNYGWSIEAQGEAGHEYIIAVVNHDAYNTDVIKYLDYNIMGVKTADKSGKLKCSGVLKAGLRFAKPEYIIIDKTQSKMVYSSGISKTKVNTVPNAITSGFYSIDNKYGLRYAFGKSTTNNKLEVTMHLTTYNFVESKRPFEYHLYFYNSKHELLKDKKVSGNMVNSDRFDSMFLSSDIESTAYITCVFDGETYDIYNAAVI